MSTRAILHARLIFLHLTGVLPKAKADTIGERINRVDSRTGVEMIAALDAAVGDPHGIG